MGERRVVPGQGSSSRDRFPGNISIQPALLCLLNVFIPAHKDAADRSDPRPELGPLMWEEGKLPG